MKRADESQKMKYFKTIVVGDYSVDFFEHKDFDPIKDKNLYDNVIEIAHVKFEEDRFLLKTIVAEVSYAGTKKTTAFVVSYYTTKECAVPMGDKIFLLFNDVVCVFDPKRGLIEKSKDLETLGTMFEAYAYEDDFILYGEIEIIRIDRDLNVKWSFFGSDIFIRQSDEPAFWMEKDKICLYDFWDNYYEIDYDGHNLRAEGGEVDGENNQMSKNVL